MNAVSVMDVKNQSDRDKVNRIIENYHEGILLKGEAIDQLFDLFTPKQYQPFEVSDFNEFMLKQVRRKGEAFKDEVWIVEGVSESLGAMVTSKDGKGVYTEWKQFQSMFDEWEFLNGECFGKLI